MWLECMVRCQCRRPVQLVISMYWNSVNVHFVCVAAGMNRGNPGSSQVDIPVQRSPDLTVPFRTINGGKHIDLCIITIIYN